MKPRHDLTPNSFDYENLPLVTANGFREYDARWLYPQEISQLGIQALGLALATLVQDMNVKPRIVVGSVQLLCPPGSLSGIGPLDRSWLLAERQL